MKNSYIKDNSANNVQFVVAVVHISTEECVFTKSFSSPIKKSKNKSKEDYGKLHDMLTCTYLNSTMTRSHRW